MESEYVVTAEPIEYEMHYVHTAACPELPDDLELIELGEFEDCDEAMEAARDQVDGAVNACAMCCPDCHAPTDDLDDAADLFEDED